MTCKDQTIPVTLHGVELVWLKDADGGGALAYPHHVAANGDIMFEHCLSDSYAHVFPDGSVMRCRQKIGTADDLQRR